MECWTCGSAAHADDDCPHRLRQRKIGQEGERLCVAPAGSTYNATRRDVQIGEVAAVVAAAGGNDRAPQALDGHDAGGCSGGGLDEADTPSVSPDISSDDDSTSTNASESSASSSASSATTASADAQRPRSVSFSSPGPPPRTTSNGARSLGGSPDERLRRHSAAQAEAEPVTGDYERHWGLIRNTLGRGGFTSGPAPIVSHSDAWRLWLKALDASLSSLPRRKQRRRAPRRLCEAAVSYQVAKYALEDLLTARRFQRGVVLLLCGFVVSASGRALFLALWCSVIGLGAALWMRATPTPPAPRGANASSKPRRYQLWVDLSREEKGVRGVPAPETTVRVLLMLSLIPSCLDIMAQFCFVRLAARMDITWLAVPLVVASLAYGVSVGLAVMERGPSELASRARFRGLMAVWYTTLSAAALTRLPRWERSDMREGLGCVLLALAAWQLGEIAPHAERSLRVGMVAVLSKILRTVGDHELSTESALELVLGRWLVDYWSQPPRFSHTGGRAMLAQAAASLSNGELAATPGVSATMARLTQWLEGRTNDPPVIRLESALETLGPSRVMVLGSLAPITFPSFCALVLVLSTGTSGLKSWGDVAFSLVLLGPLMVDAWRAQRLCVELRGDAQSPPATASMKVLALLLTKSNPALFRVWANARRALDSLRDDPTFATPSAAGVQDCAAHATGSTERVFHDKTKSLNNLKNALWNGDGTDYAASWSLRNSSDTLEPSPSLGIWGPPQLNGSPASNKKFQSAPGTPRSKPKTSSATVVLETHRPLPRSASRQDVVRGADQDSKINGELRPPSAAVGHTPSVRATPSTPTQSSPPRISARVFAAAEQVQEANADRQPEGPDTSAEETDSLPKGAGGISSDAADVDEGSSSNAETPLLPPAPLPSATTAAKESRSGQDGKDWISGAGDAIAGTTLAVVGAAGGLVGAIGGAAGGAVGSVVGIFGMGGCGTRDVGDGAGVESGRADALECRGSQSIGDANGKAADAANVAGEGDTGVEIEAAEIVSAGADADTDADVGHGTWGEPAVVHDPFGANSGCGGQPDPPPTQEVAREGKGDSDDAGTIKLFGSANGSGNATEGTTWKAGALLPCASPSAAAAETKHLCPASPASVSQAAEIHVGQSGTATPLDAETPCASPSTTEDLRQGKHAEDTTLLDARIRGTQVPGTETDRKLRDIDHETEHLGMLSGIAAWTISSAAAMAGGAAVVLLSVFTKDGERRGTEAEAKDSTQDGLPAKDRRHPVRHRT